jgi:hypothetical protein
MRPTVDGDHKELLKVLADLSAEGTDITVREVARRHPRLKNASNFTRNTKRMELIASAKQHQLSARAALTNPHIEKATGLAEQLAIAKARVTELELQLKALVASHAACVRAVMLHGGMPALERFWRDYKAIGDAVRAADGMPSGADVIQFNAPAATPKGRPR